MSSCSISSNGQSSRNCSSGQNSKPAKMVRLDKTHGDNSQTVQISQSIFLVKCFHWRKCITSLIRSTAKTAQSSLIGRGSLRGLDASNEQSA